MENIEDKIRFLESEYTKELSGLDADAPRRWGKMNVQQMIEHMAEYVRIANGRVPVEVITEDEYIPRAQAFIASDKTFKENTPNVLMPDEPAPARFSSKEEAIADLQNELDYFFEVYEKEQGKKLKNPFFGELAFDLQVQLLYKHSKHHLRQFGVN